MIKNYYAEVKKYKSNKDIVATFSRNQPEILRTHSHLQIIELRQLEELILEELIPEIKVNYANP